MVLFLTVWLNFCSVYYAHPLYVSVTNMDIDAKGKSVVFSIRMFTDDLETILHNKYNIEGWIGTPAEHRDSRRRLEEYVNERFSIVVNGGEKIELVTDSLIVNDDSVWFHFKGAARQTIQRMEIENRLLTDFFANQNNLMIIHTGKNETGFRLNRKNTKIELSLQ